MSHKNGLQTLRHVFAVEKAHMSNINFTEEEIEQILSAIEAIPFAAWRGPLESFVAWNPVKASSYAAETHAGKTVIIRYEYGVSSGFMSVTVKLEDTVVLAFSKTNAHAERILTLIHTLRDGTWKISREEQERAECERRIREEQHKRDILKSF